MLLLYLILIGLRLKKIIIIMVIYVVPENLASIMLKMLDKNIVDFKGITLKNYLKSSFPLCEGVNFLKEFVLNVSYSVQLAKTCLSGL